MSQPKTKDRPKTHLTNHKLEQARLSEKLTFEPSKLGFEGVKCYDIIHSMLMKDPSLNIRLPMTLILNCGSNCPRLLYNKNDKLKCKELRLHIRQVKRLFERLMAEVSTKTGAKLPLAVGRYVNKFTMFFMNSKEIEHLWPDSNCDAVIQEFIPPKGLVVSKTRVVVKPESTRVFVISSKARVDGVEENELMKHREESKRLKVKQHADEILYREIQPTLLKRTQIRHRLKRSEDLSSKSFIAPSPGLVKAYNLFRHDYSCTDLKVKELKQRPPVERYSAHCLSDTSSIYEVSVSKYTDIVKVAELFRTKLNETLLVNEEAKSIVVDFMQGANGEWYFVNLKFLGLVDRKRSRANLNITKVVPLMLDCNGDYCKMSRMILKESAQHLHEPHDIASLLRNRQLSGGKVQRSEIHKHRGTLRLKSAYNCSYKLMKESLSICSLCAKFYHDSAFLRNYRNSVGVRLD